MLLPALTACDGLIDGLGNKKKSAVAFSLSNVAPWGAETLLRSASETPRVVETARASLPDNWVLEASLVEEPVAPTRASNLVPNAIVHIIARKVADGTIKEANYQSDGSGHIVPDTDGPMELEAGSYYFTAYSYNNPSVNAPVTPYSTGTVSFTPYSSPTEHDLILNTTGLVSIPGSDIDLGTLTHQFSRVQYSVNIEGSPPGLVINKVELNPNYTAKLTKSTVSLAVDAATDPQTLSTSGFRMVYTGAKLPALKISGTLNSTPFTDVSVLYTQTLAPNTSYRLQISVKRDPVGWAGSNIYWDGTKLTFKPNGYTGPDAADAQRYQGVYFKWGSLVGVSTVGDFSANTPIYVYHNNQWIETDVATAYSNGYPGFSNGTDWEDIPYIETLFPLSDRNEDRFVAYKADGSNLFSNNAGDICRFIGTKGGPSGYCVPVSNKFGAPDDVSTVFNWGDEAINWYKGRNDANTADAAFSSVTSSDPTGKQVFDYASGAGYGTNFGATFPASGTRDYITGALSRVGTQGIYWSSSSLNGATYSLQGGYYFHFCATGNMPISPVGALFPAARADYNWGIPVRCVLQ
jgi:hypothetical protein